MTLSTLRGTANWVSRVFAHRHERAIMPTDQVRGGVVN